MTAMAVYAAVSYLGLRRRVATAIRMEDNIYRTEQITSPFVLGIFRPVIYLPVTVNHEDSFHVIAHEKAHIRRRDHWWKPLGFLLLTLHWFHPLMWLVTFCCAGTLSLPVMKRSLKTLAPTSGQTIPRHC
jgi:Zn-dependent protease with chaperone function